LSAAFVNVISIPLTISTPGTNIVIPGTAIGSNTATLSVNINGANYRIALYAP
jgi:hypothetical protein